MVLDEGAEYCNEKGSDEERLHQQLRSSHAQIRHGECVTDVGKGHGHNTGT